MKMNNKILSIFAKKVRDAESEEEVKEIVEETNDAIEEAQQEMEQKDVEEKRMQDNDEKLDAILKALQDLTNVLAEKTTDEDTLMEALNEVVATDEEETKDEETTEETKDEDEIENKVISTDESVEETKDACSKIVKDMKPVLAKITDSKERKMVCDALAKTLGQVKSNDTYINIMQNTSKIKDSAVDSNKELQEYYNSFNPHKQK